MTKLFEVWALDYNGREVIYFQGSLEQCERFLANGGVPSDIDTDIEIIEV